MLLKQHLRDTSNQQHASCSTCSVTVVLASRGWNGEDFFVACDEEMC
jgi:hypothetical protein